jgi:hypothetical protein
VQPESPGELLETRVVWWRNRTGLLAVLLFAAALSAFASDASLLGSGVTAPDSRGHAAAPLEVAADTVHTAGAAGEDVLPYTGIRGAALLRGLPHDGGCGGILSSRKRARQ